MKVNTILVFIGISIWVSCKKDTIPDQPYPLNNHSFSLSFNYEVDGQPLIFDTLLYVNNAGNQYKVSKLAYFLSDISLIKPDSSKVRLFDYQYLDASISATNTFSITNPPAGNYIGICLNIGVDSAHNVPGGLPNNTNNNNMEWPELMGGGYHIMKFEGYFADGSNFPGFALHVGTNDCVIPVQLFNAITIAEKNVSLMLYMNLNEWFRNPSDYDFNVDGNYTMGNTTLMSKLTTNGKDVLHF